MIWRHFFYGEFDLFLSRILTFLVNELFFFSAIFIIMFKFSQFLLEFSQFGLNIVKFDP